MTVMFRRNYYCLVAGLKEYSRDADTKGFDAPTVIAEIKEGVSGRDRRAVALLYTYYDVENIANMRAGREHFSVLGNLSREEAEEELASPSRLPASLCRVVAAYNAADKDTGSDYEDIDTSLPFERNMFAAYYALCAKSGSKFMRSWGDFDRTLRNVSAAFASRKLSLPVSEAIIGSGYIEDALARSSAADFGIKGELSYIDQVMTAVDGDMSMVDKEKRMDDIRWDMSVELTEMNYCDIDFLLGYLVRINVIHRWTVLDPEHGREMLRKLVASFVAAGSGENVA